MSEPKEIHLSEAAKLPLCGCGCGRAQPDCAWRRAPLTKEQLEHLQYEDVSIQFARSVGLYDGPARPDRLEEVLVAARGQKWAVGEGIAPGQIARGAWVTTNRGERRVIILATISRDDAWLTGYVWVDVLHRDGFVRQQRHCEHCGACEWEKHRRGEECPGLQVMRRRAKLEDGSRSAVEKAKEFHLRPPRRDVVVMVDDQSEPP